MTPRTATPPPRPSLLARYGSLAAIVVAVGLVAVLASTGRDQVTTSAGPSTSAGSAKSLLPISFQDAKKSGTVDKYDFGDNCDPATGRVKVPSVYAPPCLAPRPGVKGGATYQGVTADTITIVYYSAPANDITASIAGQLDKPAQTVATVKAYTKMFQAAF